MKVLIFIAYLTFTNWRGKGLHLSTLSIFPGVSGITNVCCVLQKRNKVNVDGFDRSYPTYLSTFQVYLQYDIDALTKENNIISC